MLEDNENLDVRENIEITEDRNCDEGCCEKKPLPRIPMYSYEFTKSAVEDDTCEEKQESRRELINKIRSLEFAIIELAEYLDTHNTDKNALKLHREYANALHELKEKYQKKYGPLTINFPCNKWRWIEEPWPWERGNF